MGQQVLIQQFDDITKEISDDVTVVPFSWDGTDYEIDLNAANKAEWAERMQFLIEHARKATKGKKSTAKPKDGEKSDHALAEERRLYLLQVRTWAKANGFDVNDTGRVPVSVVEAYEMAMGVAA